MMKVKGLRWWVVLLIFLAAVLNYMDRQTLSVLAPTIQSDLGIDDRQYADVVNFFLMAYTIAYLLSGKLVDKLGTRGSMCIFVVWWSVSNMFTSFTHGMRSLAISRFFLGLGEAGVWPCSTKAVSEWFPDRERALAIGIYSMGATIGATITPYIVVRLAAFSGTSASLIAGWRLAFFLTGVLGLLLIVPWLIFYRLPQRSKYITKEELDVIEASSSDKNASADPNSEKVWSWRRALTFKATWLLLLGRLMTDPVWYFYQFWFPKYLHSERGFSQEQLKVTWIVYAAAGLGSLFGGWFSGVLVKRGTSPVSSRLRVMFVCACLLPLSPLISTTSSSAMAMAFIFVTVMASLAWLINISALVIDLVPKHSVGTVFGIVAAGSTLGGIIMNMMVATMVAGAPVNAGGFLDQGMQAVFGRLLDLVRGAGYGRWFLIMAFLHPIAWLMLWLGGIQRSGAQKNKVLLVPQSELPGIRNS